MSLSQYLFNVFIRKAGWEKYMENILNLFREKEGILIHQTNRNERWSSWINYKNKKEKEQVIHEIQDTILETTFIHTAAREFHSLREKNITYCRRHFPYQDCFVIRNFSKFPLLLLFLFGYFIVKEGTCGCLLSYLV